MNLIDFLFTLAIVLYAGFAIGIFIVKRFYNE